MNVNEDTSFSSQDKLDTYTDNDIRIQIRLQYSALTKTEKNLADKLLENFDAFPQYSVAEFAKIADCSEITINRFCKRFGMNGFTDFRKLVSKSNEAAYDYGRYRIRKNDTMDTIFNKIIWHYQQTLRETASLYNAEAYQQAYEAICNAKSVHFFGVGDAYAVCEFAQIRFLRVGICCSAHSDLACMISTACMLGPDDVAIGISYSGETQSVNKCLEIAKANGSTTIGIVHLAKTTMSRCIDIELHTMTVDQSDSNEEIARRIAEQAIIETLYMKLITEGRERFQVQAQKSIREIIKNK